MAELYQIFVHVAYGCSAALVWQHCNILRTSGFDDVMFSHNGLMACHLLLNSDSITAEIPTKFCSVKKASKYLS